MLALPLLKSVLPNLEEFGKSAEEAATAAEKFGNRAQEKFDDLSKQTRILGKDINQVTSSADDLAKGAGLPASGSEGVKDGTGISFLTGQDKGKKAQGNADRILKGAERQLEKSEKVKTGTLAGYNTVSYTHLTLPTKRIL